MKQLVIFDATSLLYRAYFALPPLSTPRGTPIQGIYGLASALLKLWGSRKPDLAAAMFDRPEPTFRDELYKEYKAHRPPTPDDLLPQIEEAHKLFQLFGVPTFELARYEADDLIGTLVAREAGNPEMRVLIFTGDADELQLVRDPFVAVEMFKKGISETQVYDEAAVRERFGITPAQLTDYKGLVGDASDNIPGVRGIGPKTAAALLQEFGSIEELYKGLSPNIKGFAKLSGMREEALLSKKLATIRRDAPLDFGARASFVAPELNRAALKEYFKEAGFASLIKRLEGKATSASLARPAAVPARPQETRAPQELLCVTHPATLLEDRDLASPTTKIGFELKEELKSLWREGRECAPPYADLGVGFWLLDPDLKEYSPDTVGYQVFGELGKDAARDMARMYDYMHAALSREDLLLMYETVEMPLLRILARMEQEGIGVDRARLRASSTALQKEIATTVESIYHYANAPVNLNSPKQLAQFLFSTLRIAPGKTKKTKSGTFTTESGALEELRGAHPVIELILRYRELFKLSSTYFEPLERLTAEDGRLHTTFVQTGTATGRLSSRDPNLQNIPQESEWAEPLRNAFVARPQHSFLAFDYSQIELRILADISGDPLLMRAFHEGKDIHRITASQVFRKPVEEIVLSERRVAKTLNFGIIFGMGAQAFARTAKLSLQEAQKLISEYFSSFSRVREWHEEIKEQARLQGVVVTKLGRKRKLDGIFSSSPRLRAEAERIAINMPIQGYEADILKRAMIDVDRVIEERGWNERVKLLLSIHDELLFEVADDMIEEAAPFLGACLERAATLSVPVVVDAKKGPSWGALAPFLWKL